MSFQPVLPFTGYAGWAFLKRTIASQQAALQASPANQRDEAYFRENITKVTTAEQLVSDRRLLRVALTAFGLEEDIDAKAFVRKVLEGGVTDSSALANKLSDKRYYAMAKAFGFGTSATPNTQAAGFADALLEAWRTKSFEAAVGEQDDSLHLALNAEHELKTLTTSGSSENTKWFMILGSKPLREVVQTAFGLPSGVTNLDIDRQLEIFKARAQSLFGDDSVSQLSDDKTREKLIRLYLVRNEAASGNAGYSPAQAALRLLGGS